MISVDSASILEECGFMLRCTTEGTVINTSNAYSDILYF